MNKSKTKSITISNESKYRDKLATHMLSYCRWTGLKIAVSCMFNQFQAIHSVSQIAEHPALAVPLDTWAQQWERLTERGTEAEQYVAIVSVLKQLGLLVLGQETCTPPNKTHLYETMLMIGEDILPNLRYFKAKLLPSARTNRNLSLFAFVTDVATTLLAKSQHTDKMQWEDDLDRVIDKLMREVTSGKIKPNRLANWSTEMLKAYTTATQAQRELIAECIMRPYHQIATTEYLWAIEYLRMNLPISVTDVTTASTTRSIQSSTIIQYLTEKLAMLQPEVDMFSLIDPDSNDDTSADTKRAEATRSAGGQPSATDASATAKVIVVNNTLAFDAVAYAAFPVLQPSGLPYPSEMHRKIAFNKQQRSISGGTSNE